MNKRLNKWSTLARLTTVLAVSLLIAGLTGNRIAKNGTIIYAQQSPSALVGQVLATNYLAPTAGAQMAAVGGVVTNPASNFVVQISAGTVFCSGEFQSMGQLQITLLPSTTYGIFYNCAAPAAYARTAVVGPGSAPGQPGVPSTVLQPQGGEIFIAVVVCNATACGNGGNGSITDQRVPALWAVGEPVGAHLLAAGTNQDVTGLATLAGGTKAITFVIPYQATPNCFAQDVTTIANTVTAITSGGPPVTTLTLTGTGTDVIKYFCIGNPN
jgi:hypothetical protein